MANVDDEAFRNVAADSMAHGFVLEILLAAYLQPLAQDRREAFATSVLTAGQRTDHLDGLAKDEAMAKLLGDVTARMQVALEGLVFRAMRRLVQAESE
jgi:hypothetical protein